MIYRWTTLQQLKCFLIISGKLNLYIKKDYVVFTIAGTIILLITILFRLKGLRREESARIELIPFLALSSFLIPILLGIIVRPENLSTFAASKRGITTEFSSGENILKSLKSQIETEGKYKKLTVKQILYLVKKQPEKINHDFVSVEGLVFKQKESLDSFTLVRFLITCCAADATPLGINVVFFQTQELKKDTWVKVRGKIEIENKHVKIISDEVLVLDRPRDPYLY